MPELKNTFTGGKMDKDQDERILGNGLYREALNIEVATSEDSDVGAAQNILGNVQVTRAIAGPKQDYSSCSLTTWNDDGQARYYGTNQHITHVVDPQADKLYRFINTEPTSEMSHGVWMDRIVEYDTNSNIQGNWAAKEKAVMVDIYKVETNIIDIDAPPPPPSDDIKYNCIDGLCQPCGFGTAPACVGTEYSENTCGGNCTPSPPPPSDNPAVITKCTDRCDLIPPGENPQTYYYGNVNTGQPSYTIAKKIEKIPSFSSLNQALWRYPCSGGGFGGSSSNQPLARRYNVTWGFAIVNDAKDNNGNLLPFATQNWASNVSGLLYIPVFGSYTAGNATYNTVNLHCPDDFITWMNTIPDPTSYLVDNVGTPIGGVTTDHTNNWGTQSSVGSFGMTQAVTNHMFNASGNNGWNIQQSCTGQGTPWCSPHVSSVSLAGAVGVAPIVQQVYSQKCSDGPNTNYYSQNYTPTCP